MALLVKASAHEPPRRSNGAPGQQSKAPGVAGDGARRGDARAVRSAKGCAPRSGPPSLRGRGAGGLHESFIFPTAASPRDVVGVDTLKRGDLSDALILFVCLLMRRPSSSWHFSAASNAPGAGRRLAHAQRLSCDAGFNALSTSWITAPLTVPVKAVAQAAVTGVTAPTEMTLGAGAGATVGRMSLALADKAQGQPSPHGLWLEGHGALAVVPIVVLIIITRAAGANSRNRAARAIRLSVK